MGTLHLHGHDSFAWARSTWACYTCMHMLHLHGHDHPLARACSTCIGVCTSTFPMSTLSFVGVSRTSRTELSFQFIRVAIVPLCIVPTTSSQMTGSRLLLLTDQSHIRRCVLPRESPSHNLTANRYRSGLLRVPVIPITQHFLVCGLPCVSFKLSHRDAHDNATAVRT